MDQTFVGLFGRTVPTQIAGVTRHDWVADAGGLYHTATNLAAEWAASYAQALGGNAASLLPYQRAEANAEAIFTNTALNTLDPATQARDREDVQREIDATDAAMRIDAQRFGISPIVKLTNATYLQLEHTLQSSPSLEELAVQGHGLNKPPAARYDGYTNDFQNTVDSVTRYVGPNFDRGTNALSDYVDDVLLTHLPFAVITQNGHVWQLNQNGDKESDLHTAVGQANQGLFGPVLTADDFTTAPPVPKTPKTGAAPPKAAPKPLDPHKTLFGAALPATITTTDHVWTQDATGLYQTTADLQSEWRADYAALLAGQGASLTAVQRMAGNAEAVFENTGLAKLDAATQARDRIDVQRELDAIGAAMHIDAATLGISASARFTGVSYIALEETLRGNVALQELGMQGHGLNKPVDPRYNGFTNDIQNVVDNKTKFVGAGIDHNEHAIADLIDDVILTHVVFPTVMRNGVAVQLNQNGQVESALADAVAAINESAFDRVFVAREFKA